MPKIITVPLAASLLLFSMSAVASSHGWYIAADLGRPHYTDYTGGNLTPQLVNCGIDRCPYYVDVHSGDTAYKLSGIYMFDSNWGVEAGYVDLGQARTTITYSLPVTTVTLRNVKTHGWTLAGDAVYPFTDNFSITGRLGMIRARDSVEYNTVAFSGFADYHGTDWRWLVGGSLSWALTNHWLLRLNFDHFRRLGDNNSLQQYSVNTATLGVAYHF